ncbi:MAG TPA: hypothetical protein VHX17_12465 [Candidatus Cybelea sp.]|nr:hypothetical protein [Candidatus Cybelea sp.]
MRFSQGGDAFGANLTSRMLDVGWQAWLGLILIGIVVYFVLDAPSNPDSLGQKILNLWLALLDRLALPVGELPSVEERAERARRLKTTYPGLTDDTVAAFLFAQGNALTLTLSQGIRLFEARALGQIGLAGAGVVLLSFFGFRTDAAAQPSGFFGFGLLLLFVSIVVSAIALMPKRCRQPSVEIYNSPETCAEKDLAAAITLELTDGVLLYNRQLEVVRVKKGRWQGAGVVVAICAIFFLLLNFQFGGGSRSGFAPGHVNCPPNDPIVCKRIDQ